MIIKLIFWSKSEYPPSFHFIIQHHKNKTKKINKEKKTPHKHTKHAKQKDATHPKPNKKDANKTKQATQESTADIEEETDDEYYEDEEDEEDKEGVSDDEVRIVNGYNIYIFLTSTFQMNNLLD